MKLSHLLIIWVANIFPNLTFAFCPCLWCLLLLFVWIWGILKSWCTGRMNYEYLLLYLDFTIKSTNVLRVVVEQHKKGRSRFLPLGIKRWIKQIKLNAFTWNLNNCYYPHCVRAVIFGSQRKKEKKTQQNSYGEKTYI